MQNGSLIFRNQMFFLTMSSLQYSFRTFRAWIWSDKTNLLCLKISLCIYIQIIFIYSEFQNIQKFKWNHFTLSLTSHPPIKKKLSYWWFGFNLFYNSLFFRLIFIVESTISFHAFSWLDSPSFSLFRPFAHLYFHFNCNSLWEGEKKPEDSLSAIFRLTLCN